MLRIWSKVRRVECDRWEQAHDRLFWGASKGRRPLDPVWRWAVEAESCPDGAIVATSLVDIAAFYESLDHDALRRAARKHDFPETLLEAALAVYGTMARHVINGGYTAPARWATRGVIAGCSLATTLVKLYLLDIMDGLSMQFPETQLNVFIDDVAITSTGAASVVAEVVVDATLELQREVEIVGCSLAPAKTVVTASAAKVAARIGRKLGLEAEQYSHATAAKFLGADYAPTRARRGWIRSSARRKRLAKAKQRAPRLRRLRAAAGSRAKIIAAAGLVPQAGYGAEITGLDPSEWRKLRQSCAAGLGPRAGGRSLAACLLMEGDPSMLVAQQPVIRWAQEVWAAACGDTAARGIPQLIGMWHGAQKRHPRSWRDVKGPIGAAALTLQRIGWSWPSPLEFADANGTRYLLTHFSPALIRRMLVQAEVQVLEKRLAARLARRGAVGTDGRGWSAPRATAEAAARVIRSKRHPLEAKEAGCLQAVVADAVWTQSRLWDAGYQVAEECRLCGKHRDSLWHRWWQCPATKHLREDVSIVPRGTLRRAQRAREGDALFERALLEHPEVRMEPPAEDAQLEWWDAEEGYEVSIERQQFQNATVYVDGSCTTHPLVGCRRAAWAAVVVDRATGALVRRLSGVVPRAYHQTPQAAEFLLLDWVVPALGNGVELASDCLNVVKQLCMGTPQQLDGRRSYAGVSRRTGGFPRAHHALTSIRKVPAHLVETEGMDDAARADLRGNAHADAAAKAARAAHPATPPYLQTLLAQEWSDAEATARLIARAGPLWPAARPPGGRRLGKRRFREVHGCENLPAAQLKAREVARRAATHRWQSCRGVVRCGCCWAVRSKGGIAANSDCPGQSAMHRRTAEAAPRMGHDLWGASVIRSGSAPSFLMICLHCGAFSESGDNPTLHGERCTALSRHGRQQARRAKFGLHPRSGATASGALLDGANACRSTASQLRVGLRDQGCAFVL